MNQKKQQKHTEKPSSGAPRIERLRRRPELESDVHPQRRPGELPLPDESDNIPGDENDPNLVQSR